MTLGGAAQLAAAHSRMNGPWTHSLQPDRPTYLRPSQPHYNLHPAMCSRCDSLFKQALSEYP